MSCETLGLGDLKTAGVTVSELEIGDERRWPFNRKVIDVYAGYSS